MWLEDFHLDRKIEGDGLDQSWTDPGDMTARYGWSLTNLYHCSKVMGNRIYETSYAGETGLDVKEGYLVHDLGTILVDKSAADISALGWSGYEHAEPQQPPDRH